MQAADQNRPVSQTTPVRREKKKQRRRQQKQQAADAPRLVEPERKLPMVAANVDALVRSFEDGTLPRDDWTHAAHLVVALHYARDHRIEAYQRVREGIQRYNRLTGLVETPTRGFHETITRGWFVLVLHFLDLFDDGRPLADLARDLVALYDKQELFGFYSRERLLSPEARSGWVEPDLQALPALEPYTPADRRWLAALEGSLSAARVELLAAVA